MHKAYQPMHIYVDVPGHLLYKSWRNLTSLASNNTRFSYAVTACARSIYISTKLVHKTFEHNISPFG